MRIGCFAFTGLLIVLGSIQSQAYAKIDKNKIVDIGPLILSGFDDVTIDEAKNCVLAKDSIASLTKAAVPSATDQVIEIRVKIFTAGYETLLNNENEELTPADYERFAGFETKMKSDIALKCMSGAVEGLNNAKGKASK